MKKVKILDNTLRDGLYIVDFMINSKEIYSFSNKLIQADIKYIEIGHGLGIGAYKKITSGFSDRDLYSTLEPLMAEHKFFSFFIPMLSSIDDLKIPKDYRLYGIRIGIDATLIKKYYSTIEKIKNMGFFVTLNIMKSYTVSSKKLIESVKGLENIVDVLYIVDSAGHMLPDEVNSYFAELNNHCNFNDLGFHGHNNLGLATANAMIAVQNGASYIDTTLGGVGRSGGNIATESFLSIINKKNRILTEDMFLNILNLSKEFRVFIEKKGRRFMITENDVLFGYSGFHSSNEEKVRKFTAKYGLNFDKFIVEISKISKTYITDEILLKIKDKMK